MKIYTAPDWLHINKFSLLLYVSWYTAASRSIFVFMRLLGLCPGSHRCCFLTTSDMHVIWWHSLIPHHPRAQLVHSIYFVFTTYIQVVAWQFFVVATSSFLFVGVVVFVSLFTELWHPHNFNVRLIGCSIFILLRIFQNQLAEYIFSQP